MREDPSAKSRRAFQAVMQMKKLDVEGIMRAFEG
jgi:predicted 3-demethylubiquinone-9 3-methyltransferase (glyoxalase superfamily)